MSLSVHGVYSNFALTEDQILNRSYKFKQQLLIKENMARYYDKKKPTKAEKYLAPVATSTWKDDEKEEKEREKSKNVRVKQQDNHLSGIKVVGRSLMSDNEVRKINQNYVYDKLLNLKKKDIDKQLRVSMTKLKREKSILTEKFIDLEANNYKFMKNIQNRIESRMSNPRILNASVLSMSGGYASPSLFARSVQSAPAKISRTSNASFDLFRIEQVNLEHRITSAYQNDYDYVPERLNLKTPDSYKSNLETLKEKFVDQKLRCNPNYQKKRRRNNYSMTLEDLDKFLATKSSKLDACYKKKLCTKYKQHKLAQHGAEMFVSNKLLNKLDSIQKRNENNVYLLKELNKTHDKSKKSR
ncbi:unnamed protein product [Brachionus calyciflorus]|uniref:Uncharacterized protein n=1 Tax=Brachionus calyciflorus TaxID=104777 RepID=A0A813UQJ8_9BILA|nr:unnamed protein product [Brachionus calyciflorus]